MSDHWDRIFLRQALGWAYASKDPNTQVGSVIVGPDRKVRATGFNGFPRGVADTPERLGDRETKNRLMVHAERNAICSAAKIGVSLKDTTLYLAATDDSGMVWGGCPCTACAIEMIQAGIVSIVAFPRKITPSKWHADIAFSETILTEAGVSYREVSYDFAVC